ncbi:MAG: DUF5110 domain-containing protein [Marinilabiliaceae bacterium]|nr:DUF5110 domain-containing protein [Marinilabiliaceae bacterium]
MTQLKVYSMLMVAAILAGCSSSYERVAHGIVVNGESQSVRLEVLADDIIHVNAVPAGQSFSESESLIAIEQHYSKAYQVTETDTTVVLSTSKLTATICKKCVKVSFADEKGNPIIAEDKRTLEPIEVEGVKGYTMRQVWNSPSDEALYGLGQHQADEWNYKGKNEELFQYNTKVSVPIIVSSKKYAILWDNYSLTKFGDARDYQQLGKVFRLFDKNGEEGALTGTYTPAARTGAQELVRREDSLYFEYLDRSAKLSKVINSIDGFPYMGSHVLYEGEIEPSESGLFRFILYYAGYMKIYIDNQLVVPERWRTAWNPNSYKFAVNLEAGKRVPIRIDWNPDGAVSYCGLRVLTPVAEEEQNKIAFWSEIGDEVNYYFIKGDNMDDVVSGYRQVTGKATMMPKWAMGYWQSRERYKTQDEIVGVLKEFRERRIPIDNIVQDWSYWPESQWGSHEFDEARFPNPKQMVDDIHAMNGKIMISVWPKFYVDTEHYKEFEAQGWMYQQAVKDSIRDWIGPGYIGSFYDAYAPGARSLFWKQVDEHLYSLGMDAWWVDASEPNIRDCTDLQYRKDLCGPTYYGPSAKYFNAFGLMQGRGFYEGQRSVNDSNRVYILTRSGFAGQQRNATTTWSGDIATRWEDMKAQVSAGLNFAISGIPFWTMDIGGFCVESRYEAAQRLFDATGRENADLTEWRELNTRWFQFGAFCPLFRAHGQFPLREPWNIAPKGHPAYESIVSYINLRYSLMPYIYSLNGKAYFDDYTIMRPLVMDFTDDSEVNDISTQFMFGPSFMACPVTTYKARSREVYFPSNVNWYDFYTGEVVSNGAERKEVDAPYEKMPLFVRGGSIIPVAPEMQWSSEKSGKELTLYVYAGADSDFTLYEDEETNYGYEQGQYAKISFHFDNKSRSLTILGREGSYEGMLESRTFNVVIVDAESPKAMLYSTEGVKVEYSGSATTVSL